MHMILVHLDRNAATCSDKLNHETAFLCGQLSQEEGDLGRLRVLLLLESLRGLVQGWGLKRRGLEVEGSRVES